MRSTGRLNWITRRYGVKYAAKNVCHLKNSESLVKYVGFKSLESRKHGKI
jgi:hypothetical protein